MHQAPQLKFQDSLSKTPSSPALVLGLMSGTSLDGLDLALCEFHKENGTIRFRILKAETRAYNDEWTAKLKAAPKLSTEAYLALHAEYGRFIATEVNSFLGHSGQRPSLIASHGHTVFHDPERGFSAQLGCGATIAAKTGISTVCDFRSLDVALGGEGAPLVPLGDKLLFGDYQACLNIGGIANLSCEGPSGERLAFDICVANMLLNRLSERLGKAYDEEGKLAAGGKLNQNLLESLNALPFFQVKGPKSLGREWFESQLLPVMNASSSSVEDLLSTATEHVALQIAQSLSQYHIKEVLCTGGGALNNFLIERIKAHSPAKLILPEPVILHFKEALIFALLGYLRASERCNTLASVTSASRDSIGGALYLA